MLQAGSGRSGKQQQQRNSPNLGTAWGSLYSVWRGQEVRSWSAQISTLFRSPNLSTSRRLMNCAMWCPCCRHCLASLDRMSDVWQRCCFQRAVADTKQCTGILSQIRTKLRDWAVWQARAGCYFLAAFSSNDSKTLYIIATK